MTDALTRAQATSSCSDRSDRLKPLNLLRKQDDNFTLDYFLPAEKSKPKLMGKKWTKNIAHDVQVLLVCFYDTKSQVEQQELRRLIKIRSLKYACKP